MSNAPNSTATRPRSPRSGRRARMPAARAEPEAGGRRHLLARSEGWRPGGAGAVGSARSTRAADRTRDHRVRARRPAGRGRPRRDHLGRRPAPGHPHPAPLPQARARLPSGRQLPRLHGRDRGRARAGRLLQAHARRGHEGEDRDRARHQGTRHGAWSCWSPTSRSARPRTTRPRTSGARRTSSTVAESRFPAAERWAADVSHPAMRVNLDSCIQCNLCVRACREVQVNDVIGMAYRSHGAKIVFDFDDPMGQSTCVACGECVQACPTGALMPSAYLDDESNPHGLSRPRGGFAVPVLRRRLPGLLQGEGREDRLRRGRRRSGQPQPAVREGPLRLRLHPPSAPPDEAAGPAGQRRQGRVRPGRSGQPLDALPRGDLGGGAGPRRRRPQGSPRHQGPARRSAGFGSAKGSNEEAYLFQKLVRTGFGSNNVDHCTRLCHASSVAALMEGLNSGAVSAPFEAAMDAEVIIVIGANPTVNHPVAATFIKNAVKQNGAKLIVIDPRRQALSRHAYKHLAFKPGSDVAMLNAMLNVIITEKLYDEEYIAAYTENFEALKANIVDFTPEKMAAVCGIDAETLREVARLYANVQGLDHFLGHGHQPARARHGQRALPDRAGADHGPDRAQGHGAASAARPEQRAGRLGCRPDPDGLSGLPVGREGRGARAVRDVLGAEARSAERPDGRRDHERDPCRRDQRHVRRGRESGDVGSGPQPRAPGAGDARSPGRAGPVPDRDRLPRRRGAAGLGLRREVRHLHQHRPARADRRSRCCRRRAMRGRTCGSSRRSASAWGCPGTTPARPRSSPRWP